MSTNCKICNKEIPGKPRACGICGATFCVDHTHNLVLTKKGGSDVQYACLSCIKEHGLTVIDPNHPYFLCSKSNIKEN